MESGDTLKSIVELLDFFGANATVLSEKVEGLRVIIETLEVHEVLVDGVEGFLLRSS